MLTDMDEEEISANEQQPSGAQVKWKRAQNCSENIPGNEDVCQAVEPNRPGAALSDVEHSNAVKKTSCRAAAVFLGLLSLLLLIGLILLFPYTKDDSKCKIKMLQLETSYSNLKEENLQLRTSYKNLTEENLQLQTSYNNLTEDNLQLQTSYNNLTEALEKLKGVATDLRRKLQALHSHEWNYFGGNYYYLSSTENSWQEGRTDCLQKGADLVIINSPEKQEFIKRWKQVTWIGLTNLEAGGTWRWVDGTLLETPRYWAESEPNNVNGKENCVESLHLLGKGWNDLSCDEKRYWICEVRLKI